MTLRGNDLLLTVLGLLAIGLAGAEASAQMPNNLACTNPVVVNCVSQTCIQMNRGQCPGGATYDAATVTPIGVGQCTPQPEFNCVTGKVSNCTTHYFMRLPDGSCPTTQLCEAGTTASGC